MTNKHFLFIIALTGLSFLANAQERQLEKADEQYRQYSFQPAIDIYEKLRAKGYVNADLLTKLGDSYYFNAEYKKAAEAYQELLVSNDTVVGADVVFRYAQSLKTLGRYQESDKWMREFAAIAQKMELNSKVDFDYLEKIEDNSGRYDIEQFKFNSRYADFAPSYYKEGLIFASDRDTGNLARYRHTWNSSDFLDLYQVKDAADSLTTVSKVSGEVNTRFHESTSIVAKDGKTMYFTRNNFFEGKKKKDDEGTIRLKMYTAELVDSTWTNITELPFNSDSYSVAHPMLSPDEKFLYFSSDMPGTFGKSDLWKVEIVGDGTYGAPINLGSSINTQARENFPFITKEDVLYFSSDGHPGLGGLDVFATKIAFDDYNQEIVNLGKPVNGEYDDFSFIINDETHTGYFSSNRPEGMGSDDIYAFIENEPVPLDCLQDVTGTVRDRITNEILVGATVKIIDEENNEVSSTLTNSEGTYSLELDCNKGNFVRALKDGYIPAEEFLAKSYGKPATVDFYLERDVVTGGFGDDLAKLLQLSTIYFDLNKYNIRPDAEIEIQKVIAAMEKYPSLKIKVNSHTDSQGRDEYNLWLSQKRAESTVNYMISKGIASDRLIGEGFGETKLINECENGVRCSPEKHQLNRRSEFIILE
ncbi:cell envelope biogenesis protein OmpA [Croceivirga lutea]|uniref:OmpA family protein n=1 Tax=Croceivirga lutea TaxID=1775167 RepID=UPI00163A2516|nr:OmpA family protein [Croceivirga lutea]GGG51967.1 cell envelope biogenesis protein OmpA [Croceivirga lutea]